MTETSSLLTTYSVPSSYSVAALPASVSPIPNGSFSPQNVVEEEEYTIKCICGFNDDDGSTVFCEKCESWQHIICYYHPKKVPEVHLCTDCAPRDTFPDISADKARERQKRARELLEGGGDRRVKKPASKGQKKKHRDTISNDFPNGWPNHDRQESLTNGRDHPPPAKKPKTSHRASGSIASLNGESRKRAYSNVQSYPSPSKSPQELYRSPPIPQYTPEFLDLYNHDEGNTTAQDNEHTVSGSRVLSSWQTDPSLVASHHESPQNDRACFIQAESDWTNRIWPPVTVELIRGHETEGEGRTPMWKCVKLQSDITKDTIVGEIRGQVGTLDDYCQQLDGPNRWKDLSHPDPFVFFHPRMDIYIDSRRAGTRFRYIRRSCDPNVTMRSYITPDHEVHHCFVAKHDIPAGTELTASWYLSPQKFLVNENSREDKEQLFQERCDYISRMLANFGDCACTVPKCRLDQFDRRTSTKASDVSKATAGRKKKKPKHTLSPLSNGHPTTSRAGSETVKGHDEDDDHRSSSGSSGNGIRSRDLTPQGGALLDEPPMLGAGLTQREIRKIQALEKAQKEQSQKGEKKQKKRPSAASNLNTPNPPSKTSNADAKHDSGSPPLRALKDVSNRSTPSKTVPKQVRPVYVEASVQTEPEQCDEPMPPLKRRKFCTPTQRLLKKLLHHRAQCQATSPPTSPELNMQKGQSGDVEMKDATTSVSTSPSTTKSAITSPLSEFPLQSSIQAPLPSQAAHTHKVHDIFKQPAPRLSLSTLPAAPAFSIVAGTPSNVSPASVTTPSIAQSPGPIGPHTNMLSLSVASSVNPSSAKKKLSLGDYMSRRKESSTPASEKPSLGLTGSSDAEHVKVEPKDDMKIKISDSAPVAEASNAKATDNEHAVEDTPMADVEMKQYGTTIQSDSPHTVTTGVQSTMPHLQEMHKKQDTS